MNDEFYIRWLVDNRGFVFNARLEEEDICLPDIGPAAKSLPGFRLVAVQILQQLLDEQKAFTEGNSIVLPHVTVAHLPEEERNALNLPRPFPFDLELKSSGNLADRDFRYVYRFLNGRSQAFVNPKRTGAYLEITPEQTYLLSGDLYHLVEAIDAFNNRTGTGNPQEFIKMNLLEFAKIKGLAQNTGVVLDTYLKSEEVMAPKKLSIRLRRVDNETVEIEPVLCDDEQLDDDSYAPKPVLDEAQAKNFITVFDRFSSVKDIYVIPGGPRVIFRDQQKAGLNQIKKYRRVSGKQKDLLLNCPQEIFDPEVFILDGFSERVIEIGEYKPRVFPFLRPAKEPWLPPEGGVVIDGTTVYIPPAEASKLKERLSEAIHLGKPEITWNGQSIPATQDVLEAVESIAELCPSQETGSKETLENLQRSGERKNVLIIKDNFEELMYETGIRVRPGTPGFPKSLLEGVKPLEHQQKGLHWLQMRWIEGYKGALLADDMGLGKTLQALAFLAWVRELMEEQKIKAKPVLIVAPVVLLENWKEEYRRFLKPVFGPLLELHGPGLKKFKDSSLGKALGIKKEIEIKDEDEAESIIKSVGGLLLNYKEIAKSRVVLTTYETLRDYQFSLGLVHWSVMVLDEAQKIKTPFAMVTTAVKAMKYDFGICLTGTPVENSWVDLWSIVDFIQPGYLGSLKEFVTCYQNPLRKADTNLEELGRKLKDKIIPEKGKPCAHLMKRRLKEECIDGLPEKSLICYEVEMPPEQLNYYLDTVHKARERLPDPLTGPRRQHIFSTIAILRDISLHPYLPYYSEQGLADLPDEQIINASARLQKTMQILEELSRKKEKAIIFLINRKMQRVLQRLINKRFSISPEIINGEVMGERRKKLIDLFQSKDGFNVIIMSPEAAGVGLNVTAANHVIHLSRAWNPAKEDQCTDRVYRIGQERSVYVHIPLAVHPIFNNEICKGTFDLKLHRLLGYKRQLSQNVLLPPAVTDDELQTIGEEILQVDPGEKADLAIIRASDLDLMSPDIFEKAVAALYRAMGYQVTLTSSVKDYGADIIAMKSEKEGLLIQCKHTFDPQRAIGQSGVQEIISAAGVYSQDYKTDFKKCVATNAVAFTDGAKLIASANGVALISRKDMEALFEKYKVARKEILTFN